MRAIVATLFLLAQLCACAAAPRTPPPRNLSASRRALLERGLELAQRGDARGAERYLTRALRAGHPPRDVIVPLVRVCIASGRLHAALAHAEPFLRASPGAWAV